MSLWSWVNRPSELSKFTNPLFEANNLVIWPSVAPQSLQLWEGKLCILCKFVISSQGSSVNMLLFVFEDGRWWTWPSNLCVIAVFFSMWGTVLSFISMIWSHFFCSVPISDINGDNSMGTAVYVGYFPQIERYISIFNCDYKFTNLTMFRYTIQSCQVYLYCCETGLQNFSSYKSETLYSLNNFPLFHSAAPG